MRGVNTENQVGSKIVRGNRGGGVVVKYQQVRLVIAGKVVGGKIPMSVSQPAVGLHGAHGVEVLPDKVGRFHTLQHVAVHSVGSQHKVIAQAL